MKNNKKGFTLAELLIVVAIIAVLVLIAIPVFTSSLNKSKYAADEANARSIYAAASADYLANNHIDEDAATVTVTGVNYTYTDGDGVETVVTFSNRATSLQITKSTTSGGPVVSFVSQDGTATFGN